MIVGEDGELLNEMNDAAKTLIQQIKNHLKTHYKPADEISEAQFHYSTIEVFNKIHSLFPSECYSVGDVAEWLTEAGFKWIDIGAMKFEWIFRKNS